MENKSETEYKAIIEKLHKQILSLKRRLRACKKEKEQIESDASWDKYPDRMGS